MYKIISVSGYTLAADGAEYVVTASCGKEVFRGMNKTRAEATMRDLVALQTTAEKRLA